MFSSSDFILAQAMEMKMSGHFLLCIVALLELSYILYITESKKI